LRASERERGLGVVLRGPVAPQSAFHSRRRARRSTTRRPRAACSESRTNGTHVNDERVQEVQWRAGDRRQIGGTIRKFDALRLTRG
jgi:hypothetical protein